MKGKWLLGLGEERHRRWVMAERLWDKRTERWGAPEQPEVLGSSGEGKEKVKGLNSTEKEEVARGTY